MPYIIAVGIVIFVLSLMASYWYYVLPIALVALAGMILPGVIRNILKNRYFASEDFLARKAAIASVVHEHNEIAAYTSEIRGRGTFQLGVAATGANAHLASFENTSNHSYRRDRNVANYQARNVHNCSCQLSAMLAPIPSSI